jgi:hypothetical protein
MKASHTSANRTRGLQSAGLSSWLERQYCASVAATLLARNEYFELLEDAMVSPVRLVQALHAWRQHADHAEALGGLVGMA